MNLKRDDGIWGTESPGADIKTSVIDRGYIHIFSYKFAAIHYFCAAGEMFLCV